MHRHWDIIGCCVPQCISASTGHVQAHPFVCLQKAMVQILEKENNKSRKDFLVSGCVVLKEQRGACLQRPRAWRRGWPSRAARAAPTVFAPAAPAALHHEMQRTQHCCQRTLRLAAQCPHVNTCKLACTAHSQSLSDAWHSPKQVLPKPAAHYAAMPHTGRVGRGDVDDDKVRVGA